MNESLYTTAFFDNERRASERGAKVMVPMLMRLFHPATVLDVGCGAGSFLKEFVSEGVRRAVGVEDHIDPAFIQSPRIEYIEADVSEAFSVPPERFDLALCLEVGEHLPKESARALVENLTRHSDAICFSAGVPGQGGRDHVNEQWPNYWARLFREAGYLPFDSLRPTLLREMEVPVYYAQNTVLYLWDGSHTQLGPGGYVPFFIRGDEHHTDLLNRMPPKFREWFYWAFRKARLERVSRAIRA